MSSKLFLHSRRPLNPQSSTAYFRPPSLTLSIAASFTLFAFTTFLTDFRPLSTSPSSYPSVIITHPLPSPRSPRRQIHNACLQYVLYDKPVKTGSSALASAIRKYFALRGENDYPCSYEKCQDTALAICNTSIPPRHLLGHLIPDPYIKSCTRSASFYLVTSIRDPLQRWRSMYKYNKQLRTEHYGISHTRSYTYFMDHVPECALFDYYDRKGEHCADGPDVLERIHHIVQRFDEVIDLYHDPNTDLHARIAPFLVKDNVSQEPLGEMGAAVNETRMHNERLLYAALKKKSLMPPQPPRTLCKDFV